MPLPQEGALRRAGRPRRHADEGRVIGADPVDGLDRRPGRGQIDANVGHHNRPGQRPPHPAGGLLPIEDGSPRPGADHHGGELRLGVGGVGRHHHQAGPQAGHVGHERIHRRGRGPQDPVAGLEPGAQQPPGYPTGGLLEGGVGPPSATPGLQPQAVVRRLGPAPQEGMDESPVGRQRLGPLMVPGRKVIGPGSGPSPPRSPQPAGAVSGAAGNTTTFNRHVLDIPRLELSSSPSELGLKPVTPGSVFVVDGVGETAVEDAHQSVAEVAEGGVVGVSGGPAVVVEGPSSW